MTTRQRIAALLLAIAIALLVWSCATPVVDDQAHTPSDEPAETTTGETTGFRMIGQLDFALLPEASGLSVSRIDSNRLWLVNDQGNAPALIAIDTTSMLATSQIVTGASNRDWEDLAGFTLDGQPWLMIADVGDNNAVRDDVSLIFLPEPVDPNGAKTLPSSRVSFRYPDGPRDVESVAVDTTRDSIFLLSKRTSPPVLYRLPLATTMAAATNNQSQPLIAERLGPVGSIPSPTAMELKLFPEFGRYRNQPTAMDMAADGSTIALLTYGEAYSVKLSPEQTVLDALNEPLTPLLMPVLAQPETIALDAMGHVFISTERRDAPLLVRRLAGAETP